MKATPPFSYYLLLGLTYMQAVLPLWMVRLQSRILAGLLHTVVRYRRKVVRDNLTRCFPEKSLPEIRRIERRFYYNFTYQILSSFKLLTYSEAQLRRHISFENLDVLIRLRAEGHLAILLMMGHFGNWEYFSGSQAIIKDLGLQIYQIFRPLKSTSSDLLMHRIRERFGSRGIAKHDVPRELLRLVRNPIPTETPLVIFIADQSPAYAGSYWTTFFDRETAFFNGTEKLSRKFSLPVVYMDVEKTGRDAFTGTIKLLHHPQDNSPEGSITEQYVRLMETTIRRDPSQWLWSHRRWKRPRLHNTPPVMTTAVIILNWNGRKMLEEFLPSLIAHTPRQSARLIVADNGSTDDSVEFLRRRYPQVELILFPENYGFAEGYNRAIAQTECDCVVLLNSDVEVTEGWLDAPLALLQERTDVAAVQPKIRALRDKHAFEYAGAAGGYVDRWGYPFCRGRIFDTVETDTGQYDDTTEVFWASGAALFIRRQVYMAVGGLDPRFFAHQEEIDLCWRLHSRGWRIAVAPGSTVFHLGGGSLDMKNPRKVYLNFRNNLLMLYKNLPETALKPTMRIRALLDFLSAMVFLLTGKFRHMQAVFRARRDFRRMRPDFSASRSENLLLGSIPAPMKPYSIVFQFYIRRRKIFSRLP